jgi:hypothetical protein
MEVTVKKNQNRRSAKQNANVNPLVAAVIAALQAQPVVAAAAQPENVQSKAAVKVLRRRIDIGTVELENKGQSTGGRTKFGTKKPIVIGNLELFVTGYERQ